MRLSYVFELEIISEIIPGLFVAMDHAPYLYRQFGFDVDGLKKAMLNF